MAVFNIHRGTLAGRHLPFRTHGDDSYTVLPKLTNQMPCYIVSRGADYKIISLIRPAAGRIAKLLLLSVPLRGE